MYPGDGGLLLALQALFERPELAASLAPRHLRLVLLLGAPQRIAHRDLQDNCFTQLCSGQLLYITMQTFMSPPAVCVRRAPSRGPSLRSFTA